VPAQNQRPFLDAMTELKRQRRRDGAYQWGIYQDAAEPEHFVETFHLTSWLEHLRQHERVTEADRQLQERIAALLVPGTTSAISHLIAPDEYEW
jgi:hypothetical protein